MFRTMQTAAWPAALSVLLSHRQTTGWALLLLITRAIICRVRLIRWYFPISSSTTPRSSLLPAMGPGRALMLYRTINVTHVSQALSPYLSYSQPYYYWVLVFTWQQNSVLFIYQASSTQFRLQLILAYNFLCQI